MQSMLVRVLVMAVAALGLLGGAAFATEDGGTRRADAVITACATKQGTLRVVSDASACRRNETALKWNVTGPKGDPGPKGDHRRQGRAGRSRREGRPGRQGRGGAARATGVATGARGPRARPAPRVPGAGRPGRRGHRAAGAQGAPGAAGPGPGPAGATGPDGSGRADRAAGAEGRPGHRRRPGLVRRPRRARTAPTAAGPGRSSSPTTPRATRRSRAPSVRPPPPSAASAAAPPPPPPPPPPPSSSVRVNEVSTGTTGSAADEFVELVNPGTSALDICGWKVVYRSAAGTSDTTLATIPAGTTIAAGGFYLARRQRLRGHGDGRSVVQRGPRRHGRRRRRPRRDRRARRQRRLGNGDERARRGLARPGTAVDGLTGIEHRPPPRRPRHERQRVRLHGHLDGHAEGGEPVTGGAPAAIERSARGLHGHARRRARAGRSAPASEGAPPRRIADITTAGGADAVAGALWRLPPHTRGRRHMERAQEEVFVVLEGTLTMLLGDPPERFDLPPESVVSVARDRAPDAQRVGRRGRRLRLRRPAGQRARPSTSTTSSSESPSRRARAG